MVRRIEKELKARFGTSLKPWDPQGPGGNQAGVWQKHSATSLHGGHEVLVFLYDTEANAHSPTGSAALWTPWAGAKSALEMWQSKAVRESPYHLTLTDSFADEASQSLFVVFQKAESLRDVIHGFCASEIILTLHDVAQGLILLHEQLDVSHNCLSLNALYVTHHGGRRRAVVGDLEFCLPMDDKLDKALPRIRQYRTQLHPEEESAIVVTYRGASVWSRDSYSLAIIASAMWGAPSPSSKDEPYRELVQWAEEAASGMVTQRGSVDSSQHPPVGNTSGLLMAHNAVLPPERPSLQRLLACSAFRRSALVEICQNVDCGGSLHFFSALHDYLAHVPYGVFVDVLLPCFTSDAFWRAASGASVFIGKLTGGKDAKGSCLERVHREAVLAYLLSAMRQKALRVPVERVVESAMPALQSEVLLEGVLMEALRAVEACEGHEEVYWGLHTVIAAGRELLPRGDPGFQTRVAAAINTQAIPLLLTYTQGVRFSTKVRSTSLLALVQLVALDACISEGAPGSLLQAISGTLLSGDDELCHHALNAAVMAESILPYKTLALGLLPVTAMVALSPNPKLREKCLQVSAHLLQALEEIDDAECEDVDLPPLYHGCKLAVAPPPDKDKKKLWRDTPSGAGSSPHPPDHGEGVLDHPPPWGHEATPLSDSEFIDTAWNGEGLLQVKGGGRADLRTVAVPSDTPAEKATLVTGKKKRGRVKKKPLSALRANASEASPTNDEDNELSMWERRTFDPELGEPYSTMLGDTFPSMGRPEADTLSIETGETTTSAGTAPAKRKKKKKRASAAAAADAPCDAAGTPQPVSPGGGDEGARAVVTDHTTSPVSDLPPEGAKRKKRAAKKKAGASPFAAAADAAEGTPDTALFATQASAASADLADAEQSPTVGSPPLRVVLPAAACPEGRGVAAEVSSPGSLPESRGVCGEVEEDGGGESAGPSPSGGAEGALSEEGVLGAGEAVPGAGKLPTKKKGRKKKKAAAVSPASAEARGGAVEGGLCEGDAQAAGAEDV